MPQNLGVKTVKISAKIPVKEDKALKQMAKDNGRSIASEIRIAIHDRLQQDGRIV